MFMYQMALQQESYLSPALLPYNGQTYCLQYRPRRMSVAQGQVERERLAYRESQASIVRSSYPSVPYTTIESQKETARGLTVGSWRLLSRIRKQAYVVFVARNV